MVDMRASKSLSIILLEPITNNTMTLRGTYHLEMFAVKLHQLTFCAEVVDLLLMIGHQQVKLDHKLNS